MNSLIFSAPEPLESRIAPAGLVTVTFANGLLTVSGADGADHDIEIVKTGLNTFRVQGEATAINKLGQFSKSYNGDLNYLRIAGGTGADTYQLTNLNPLHSLRFLGDAGVDSLSTTNLKTTVGGKVHIELGAQSGTIDFGGGRTDLNGYLTVNLGDGGALRFNSPSTTVDGNVTITGGPGSDSVSVNGTKTLFKHKLTYNGGDGNDSFVSTGSSLHVRGFVAMDGGAGTNLFLFAADANKFGTTTAVGLVDLKLGVGPGTAAFLGDSTNIMGDLKIDLGTGGGSAQLKSAVTTVHNNVMVTGGVGNDTLEFDGRVTIGTKLSFVGGMGDDSFRAMGGLLSVTGATSMDGGPGAEASVFTINVVTLDLASVTFTGGTSNDTVSIIADGTIAGDVSIQMGLDGTGPSSTILKSRAEITNGLKFAGTLTIDMRGATVDVLTIANIQVAKAFTAQTGENVSTIDITKLNGKGNVTLRTGDNADVVNIDNINARDLYIDTESGADELRIERRDLYTGTSTVLGIATILTGIGADQIRIGNAADPGNLKTFFYGQMTLDAGDGANMRNDIVGSNYFVSAPVIVATGGTLTQTEAI